MTAQGVAAMLLWLVLALITHGSHLALLQRHAAVVTPQRDTRAAAVRGSGPGQDADPDPNVARLPSASTLARLSLGYNHLMADYFWMRSVADYGDKRYASRRWPNLLPLLARAQALDPKFAAPYIFAGHVMTSRDMPWRRVLDFLQRGTKERPDAWDIAFLYGFNLYFLAEDFHGAAQVVAQAAQVHGAPPFLALLATRLAGEAGDPEVGLHMLDALLAQGPESGEASQLRERRRRLQLDVDLRALNRASLDYRLAHGKAPASLDALVGPHGLARVPLDPFGGSYALGGDGIIASRHHNGPLRLATPATQLDPADDAPGHEQALGPPPAGGGPQGPRRKDKEDGDHPGH